MPSRTNAQTGRRGAAPMGNYQVYDHAPVKKRGGRRESPWPGRDAELVGHWASGLSTTKIGKVMNISKNAVVGRSHRLKLPVRESPITKRDPSLPRPAYLGNPKPPPLATLMAEQAATRQEVTPEVPEPVKPAPAAGQPLGGAVQLTEARARSKAALAPVEIPKPAPAPEPARPAVEREGCRFPMWPHNTRTPNPPLFCDAAKQPRISYCAEHAKLCFTAAGARLWGALA